MQLYKNVSLVEQNYTSSMKKRKSPFALRTHLRRGRWSNTVSHAVMLPLTLLSAAFRCGGPIWHDARPVLASVSV